MALSPLPYTLHLPLLHHSPPSPASLFLCLTPSPPRKALAFSPIDLRASWRSKNFRSSTSEDDRWSELEAPPDAGVSGSDGVEIPTEDRSPVTASRASTASSSSFGDSLSLGIREPVYEVKFHVLFISLVFYAWRFSRLIYDDSLAKTLFYFQSIAFYFYCTRH